MSIRIFFSVFFCFSLADHPPSQGLVNNKVNFGFTEDEEGLGGPLEAGTGTGTGGGHLFNRGYMNIKGDAVFRQGVSRSDVSKINRTLKD